MTRAAKLWTIALAAIALLFAHPAGAQESRRIGDWYAACDNLLGCTAYGFVPGDLGAWIEVQRYWGEDVDHEIRFGFRSSDFVDPKGWAVKVDGVTVIDGLEFQLQVAKPFLYEASLDDFDQANRLAAALRTGREASLEGPGGQRYAFSLKDGGQALAFIDEVQRRPLPAEIEVRPAPMVEQTGRPDDPPTLRHPANFPGCENLARRKTLWIKLTDDLHIWGYPCSRDGETIGHRLFTADATGGSLQPLVLTDLDGSSRNVTGVADFAPGLMSLYEFDSPPPYDGCGTLRRWTWTGDRFVLTLKSEIPICPGVSRDDWQPLYEPIVETSE